ncbi:MAG: hypothetical protein GEV11_24240 [Streptosporangiales bacterium]|nr:hypothetical protein [Streptosporangiales bacterium]
MTAALSVAVFAVAYVLIASEKLNRVVVAVGGAAVVAALGIVGADDIFYSHDTGIDWNVIFLLFGMMIIVGVLRPTGVFEYLAIWAAKRARGRPYRVMVLLTAITAVASAGLDNVTTVLLIAPVTLLVCDRLNVNPIPYLIAEVLASNIGGTATLIGDPPNIIIGSRAGLTFNDFVVHLGPIVVVMMAVFFGLIRFLFRDAFRYDPDRAAEVMALNEREAIEDPRLLVRCLIVVGAVLVAFTLHSVLHVDASIIALLGAAVIVAISRSRTEQFLRDVEWESLVFFMGLFIMVGAMVKTGVIAAVADWATEATGGNLLLATNVLLVASGVLSAVVDNIPYVATMAPLVQQLTEGYGPEGQVLWWALALGADLGGNATAIGASANVVVLGIAKRNGHPITFWQFTKYGIVVAAVTILMCVPYLWLRYFVFA